MYENRQHWAWSQVKLSEEITSFLFLAVYFPQSRPPSKQKKFINRKRENKRISADFIGEPFSTFFFCLIGTCVSFSDQAI